MRPSREVVHASTLSSPVPATPVAGFRFPPELTHARCPQAATATRISIGLSRSLRRSDHAHTAVQKICASEREFFVRRPDMGVMDTKPAIAAANIEFAEQSHPPRKWQFGLKADD